MNKKKTTISFTDEEINFILIALEGSIGKLQEEIGVLKAKQEMNWTNQDKENFRNNILNEISATNTADKVEAVRDKILAIIEKGGEK